MAQDEMTGGEFQSMVGYQPTKQASTYEGRVKQAEQAHQSQWSDPAYAAKVLGGVHDAYHATGGSDNLNGGWKDRAARAAQNIASMHARATGQSTASVLQAHGFHPVTGHSLHPAPSTPTHTAVDGSFKVRPI